MKRTPERIEKYCSLLIEIPSAVAVIISPLGPEQLNYAPGPKEWSVIQNFAHLRSCAEVWTFSIYAMLVEDSPSLPRLHPRDWNRVARYEQGDFGAFLNYYLQQRQELVGVLRPLPTSSWERAALIDGRHHTIFSQVRRMAKHEENHLVQIKDLLNLPQ